MTSTKYPVVMSNGQRIYTNPAPSSPPPRGSEVFIGNLPRDLLEDDLIPLFAQVAPVRKFRLMMDFSGRNRGFAFAAYYSAEAAHRAAARFNRTYVQGRRRRSFISVHVSLDNRRLFFGNVPRDASRKEVEEGLRGLVEGVVRVMVYAEKGRPGRNRGFAFVEFETHAMAAIARRRMLAGVGQVWRDQDGRDHKLYVDWAEPEPIVDPMVQTEVKILFFKNVPIHWSGDRFKEFIVTLLKTLPIEKVYKRDNYAFVHFYTRTGAELALKLLETMTHLLIFSDQQMEVEWARPADYSKRNRANQLPDNLCLSVPPKTRKVIYNSKKSNHFSLFSSSDLDDFQKDVLPNINSIDIAPRNKLSFMFENLSLGTGF